ncbi:MAG: hypothetical protein Q4G04_02975 [bacterium]|nr:hypothetical protein [bacterium]
MGREERKKRQTLNKINENPNSNSELKKFIIIAAIILGVYVIAYLIIGIFVTKEIDLSSLIKNEEESEKVIIDSSHILASETFKLKDETYYVYFNSYEEANSNIELIITNYLSNEKVYRVDTDSVFNNKYVTEETNKSAQNIEQLKVKEPTIIKIEAGENVLYLEGEETITEYFK